jgi:hypothetical protein
LLQESGRGPIREDRFFILFSVYGWQLFAQENLIGPLGESFVFAQRRGSRRSSNVALNYRRWSEAGPKMQGGPRRMNE